MHVLTAITSYSFSLPNDDIIIAICIDGITVDKNSVVATESN